MSRTHYSDDFGEDFPNQLELYRANVDRSMSSKKGRKMLREVLAALDAMPVRELYADIFVETRDRPSVDPWPHLPPDDDARETVAPKGAACGLGAWAIHTLGPEKAAALFANPEPDSLEMADRLEALGWPPLVVHEIVFENDHQDARWRYVTVEGPKTHRQHLADYDHLGSCAHRYRPVRYRVEETPSERWQRVRDWVQERLNTFERWDANIAAWKKAHPYTTPSPNGVGLL